MDVDQKCSISCLIVCVFLLVLLIPFFFFSVKKKIKKMNLKTLTVYLDKEVFIIFLIW